MFTGLIQSIGTIGEIKPSDKGTELFVNCKLAPYELGESIAVNGACLTVTFGNEKGFRCYASEETLQKTILGSLTLGDKVHLERALKVGDAMGGHFVSGHIDGVAFVKSIVSVEQSLRMVFEVPTHLQKHLPPKGSVAINGVSLTVNEVEKNTFGVMLIPHTLNETQLCSLKVGAKVNIETDMLAKYVESFLGSQNDSQANPLNKEALLKAGFSKV